MVRLWVTALPSLHEAVGSIPSTAKQNKKSLHFSEPQFLCLHTKEKYAYFWASYLDGGRQHRSISRDHRSRSSLTVPSASLPCCGWQPADLDSNSREPPLPPCLPLFPGHVHAAPLRPGWVILNPHISPVPSSSAYSSDSQHPARRRP